MPRFTLWPRRRSRPQGLDDIMDISLRCGAPGVRLVAGTIRSDGRYALCLTEYGSETLEHHWRFYSTLQEAELDALAVRRLLIAAESGQEA